MPGQPRHSRRDDGSISNPPLPDTTESETLDSTERATRAAALQDPDNPDQPVPEAR
jgi:hypothetical protein